MKFRFLILDNIREYFDSWLYIAPRKRRSLVVLGGWSKKLDFTVKLCALCTELDSEVQCLGTATENEKTPTLSWYKVQQESKYPLMAFSVDREQDCEIVRLI